MVQNPLKIQEKNQKNFFLDIYPGTKSPFLGQNNFPNFFWLQLVPGTTIEKKTQLVPGTKYGVFRYIFKNRHKKTLNSPYFYSPLKSSKIPLKNTKMTHLPL
jgi:hypothetical protein